MLTRRTSPLAAAALAVLLSSGTHAVADEGAPLSGVHVERDDGRSVRTEAISGIRKEVRRSGALRRKPAGLPGLGRLARPAREVPQPSSWLCASIQDTQGLPKQCDVRRFVRAPVPAGRSRPAAVRARDLVVRAVNLLRLPSPHAQIRPMVTFHDGAVGGLTGAPLWLWVPDRHWRTLHQRTAAGAAWAEVTARPVAQTWTFGDGSRPLTCLSPGTEITRSNAHRGLEGSPSCGYTYTVSSRDQPEQRYTIEVTVDWQVSWTGSGDTGGILPLFHRQQTVPYTVRQARAQLVDPDN
jgi:hypothetical protein